MAVQIYGLSNVVREPGAILAQEPSGLVTFRESRVGKTADVITAFNSLTRNVTASPDFINLKLDSKSITYAEGGQAHLNLVWAGPDAGEGDPELPAPVWRLNRTPSSEPIDSHPEFESFAGTPDAPLNGAEFDENGLFIGFVSADPNIWGGVTKYLQFAAVVTKTSVVNSVSTNQAIPRIDTPIGAPWPLPTTVDWLKTNMDVVARGGVFEVMEEWTMSGPRGWNETLYPA